MGNPKLITLTVLLICLWTRSVAQTDSMLPSVQDIPNKYISQVNKKIDRYSNRLTSKTEKTLTKLVQWENRIHGLLQKASPETAERLFANKDITFAGLLEKLQQGKSITANVTAPYNEYRDQLSTSLKYIQQQKSLFDSNAAKVVALTSQKMDGLEEEVRQTEAVQQFIKQRKQQLISEGIQYIGKSKYLTRINKESYYYVETLKNYKELFADSKKAEQTAKEILNKIPAFQKFAQQNSMLASIFAVPDNYGTPQSLAGLQTRTNVNALLQDRIAAGGPNAQDMMKQQLQMAQEELAKLKQKITMGGARSTDDELPDFKPNGQRSKTFGQRLEYGNNLQFEKSNLIPASANIGLSIGYKLNDKSVAGIGLSYKLGMGSIQHIKFSHEGVGLRSYADWKWKKNLYVSGGYEMNYTTAFSKISALKNISGWQQSGLIGLMKKLPMKTKLIKNTQVKILFDFLYGAHNPVTQPVIFRVGYGF